jgi:hypothetical protein
MRAPALPGSPSALKPREGHVQLGGRLPVPPIGSFGAGLTRRAWFGKGSVRTRASR